MKLPLTLRSDTRQQRPTRQALYALFGLALLVGRQTPAPAQNASFGNPWKFTNGGWVRPIIALSPSGRYIAALCPSAGTALPPLYPMGPNVAQIDRGVVTILHTDLVIWSVNDGHEVARASGISTPASIGWSRDGSRLRVGQRLWRFAKEKLTRLSSPLRDASPTWSDLDSDVALAGQISSRNRGLMQLQAYRISTGKSIALAPHLHALLEDHNADASRWETQKTRWAPDLKNWPLAANIDYAHGLHEEDVALAPRYVLSAKGKGTKSPVSKGTQPKVIPPKATPPKATPPKATPPKATPPRLTPPKIASTKGTPPKPPTVRIAFRSAWLEPDVTSSAALHLDPNRPLQHRTTQVAVWNAITGRRLWTTSVPFLALDSASGHEPPVLWSPNGRTIVVMGGTDPTLPPQPQKERHGIRDRASVTLLDAATGVRRGTIRLFQNPAPDPENEPQWCNYKGKETLVLDDWSQSGSGTPTGGKHTLRFFDVRTGHETLRWDVSAFWPLENLSATKLRLGRDWWRDSWSVDAAGKHLALATVDGGCKVYGVPGTS